MIAALSISVPVKRPLSFANSVLERSHMKNTALTKNASDKDTIASTPPFKSGGHIKTAVMRRYKTILKILPATAIPHILFDF
jgi:hypothetical protein